MRPIAVKYHSFMEVATWVYAVKIRLLMKMDLPALEWEGEYTHFRRMYADAYERAHNGRSILWVADLPETGIIGQLFVQLNTEWTELMGGEKRGYIYAFRVRSAYRNSGLGTRMMDVAEADLIRRGFDVVTLNVAKNNPKAQQLYENLGYRVVSSEPGRWSYIDDKGAWQSVEEPAWHMEKRIPKP
jgi:ribosomal protein S18 acetylase RimI-like enzyme